MTLRNLVPLRRREVPVRRGYEPLSTFTQDIDRLWNDFFKGYGLEPFTDRLGQFSPTIDVKEDEKEIKVQAELPGMDEQDIDIALNRDSLTIKGEKKEETEEKEKDYYRMERSYGSFTRTIPLPEEIDTDKAEARFKKGVLTVTLPKTEETRKKTKKIKVEAA